MGMAIVIKASRIIIITPSTVVVAVIGLCIEMSKNGLAGGPWANKKVVGKSRADNNQINFWCNFINALFIQSSYFGSSVSRSGTNGATIFINITDSLGKNLISLLVIWI